MHHLNRSMRGNLVFRNIPEEKDGNPELTKKILAETLAINFKPKLPDEIVHDIVRVHRSPPMPGNNNPQPIFAKFTRENIAEDINNDLSKMKAVAKSGSLFKCMKQYTKSFQERRNKAMIKRRELLHKKNNYQGFCGISCCNYYVPRQE